MELNLYQYKSTFNEIKLKKFIITTKQIYYKNYYNNLFDFYNLLKIKVLKQEIYENKYLMTYKKLYALRNIIIYLSLKSYNQNTFKRICFNIWYNNIKSHILKMDKNNNKNAFLQLKKEAYLRKIFLNKILKTIKIKNNSLTVRKYFLLLMKYYMYLFDKYYIRSIKLAKSVYNYVRKRLKPIKSIFFVKLDFNLTEEDIINLYKYILINYIKAENIPNNKKDMALSLINAYNKTIKHNYENLINELYKNNSIYIILYKSIFNKILINKNISNRFSLWKQNTLNESVLINFQLKEKFTNRLILSKIYMFILVIKKIIKKIFELLYNNIYIKQTNGLILLDSYELLSVLNFESLYDNYLINVLKGIYKLHNFKNMNYLRIFRMNDKNKENISLNLWKKNKSVVCNYLNNNINLNYSNINIIKGTYISDKIFFLSYNKRINNKINYLLRTYNYNWKLFFVKLNILVYILQKKIINKRKKYLFYYLYDVFKLSEEEKILKKEISLFIQSIKNLFLIKIFKYKNIFFLELKNDYKNINKYQNSKNIYYNNIKKIPNYKINFKITKNKLKEEKLLALHKIMKYFINNSIKRHFLQSLKNSFYHWSLLSGNIPNIIRETNNHIFNDDSEDEEDVLTQRNEIKELQKCLKEDQDFQHDLKAKITALDEENEFICEKIFEITQRVERCEKCSNLLRSSNISDNNIKLSKESVIKTNDENNNIQKSRNMVPKEGTFSSGLNFYTAGTDLIPRKPQASLNHDEASDPGSEQIDDIDENEVENNDMAQPYLIGIKQKILDLKQEKEPIINKLKNEIKSLYLELNMT